MSMRESISNVANLLVKVHDADLKAQLQEALLNAQGEALDLQVQVAQLQEEKAKLAEQLREKSRTTDLGEKLYYARNGYWRRDETIVSAFCPTCWDAKGLLMRLDDFGEGRGVCHHCQECYESVYNGGRPAEGEPKRPSL